MMPRSHLSYSFFPFLSLTLVSNLKIITFRPQRFKKERERERERERRERKRERERMREREETQRWVLRTQLGSIQQHT